MASMDALTSVLEETDSKGRVVSYACEYLTTQAGPPYNDLPELEIPSIYDLSYECSNDPVDLREDIASQLVQRVAEYWEIVPSGKTCTGIAVIREENGLIEVVAEEQSFSSLSCQVLSPAEGECCIVVQQKMKFRTYIPNNEDNLWKFVTDTLIANDLEGDFQTAAFFQTDQDGMLDGTDLFNDDEDTSSPDSGSLSAAEQGQEAQPDGAGKFSMIGAVVFGFLALTLLSLVIMVVARRRSAKRGERVDNAYVDDNGNAYVDENGDVEIRYDDSDYSEENSAVRVTVLSDDAAVNDISTWTYALEDRDKEDYGRSHRYGNGLSGNFRNDIMGTHLRHGETPSPKRRHHGPTTIEVVPPYSLEETTSDSEQDSWAQTDGTVGSLEERLEEITAEI